MKRVKRGIVLVAVLALPLALAAQWATNREAPSSQTTSASGAPPREDARAESTIAAIRIYPSF